MNHAGCCTHTPAGLAPWPGSTWDTGWLAAPQYEGAVAGTPTSKSTNPGLRAKGHAIPDSGQCEGAAPGELSPGPHRQEHESRTAGHGGQVNPGGSAREMQQVSQQHTNPGMRTSPDGRPHAFRGPPVIGLRRAGPQAPQRPAWDGPPTQTPSPERGSTGQLVGQAGWRGENHHPFTRGGRRTISRS